MRVYFVQGILLIAIVHVFSAPDLGVWTNIFLSVIKLTGGLFFNSAVLVADAGIFDQFTHM